MVANEMLRDSTNLRQNDNFAVELDTFHDKRNDFSSMSLPSAGCGTASPPTSAATMATGIRCVEAKARRDDKGWIAEIAIPFKSLRYKAGRDQVWGINLRRGIRSKNENAYAADPAAVGRRGYLPRVRRGDAGRPGAAALGQNLEIKLASINRLTTDCLAVPSTTNHLDADVALDAKYGLTKSLTADLTYNTDFAQVEADEVHATSPGSACSSPRNATSSSRDKARSSSATCPPPAARPQLARAPAAARPTRRPSSTAVASGWPTAS